MTPSDGPLHVRLARKFAREHLRAQRGIDDTRRSDVEERVVAYFAGLPDSAFPGVEAGRGAEALRQLAELWSEHFLVGFGELAAAHVTRAAGFLPEAEREIRVHELVVALSKKQARSWRAILERAGPPRELRLESLIAKRFQWRESRETHQLTPAGYLIQRRAGEILREPPFVLAPRFGARAYRLEHAAEIFEGDARPQRLREAVRAVSAVPLTLGTESSSRAPAYYTDENFQRVLVLIAEALGGVVLLDDLRDVLGEVLAPYAFVAVSDPDLLTLQRDSEPAPDDEALANAGSRELLRQLDGEARTVAGLYSLRVTRETTARVIGRTPPTVDARLATARRVLAALRDPLVPAGARDLAFESVAATLEREALETIVEWTLRKPPFANQPGTSTTGDRDAVVGAARRAAPKIANRAKRGQEWWRTLLTGVERELGVPLSLDDAVAAAGEILDILEQSEPSDDE